MTTLSFGIFLIIVSFLGRFYLKAMLVIGILMIILYVFSGNEYRRYYDTVTLNVSELFLNYSGYGIVKIKEQSTIFGNEILGNKYINNNNETGIIDSTIKKIIE